MKGILLCLALALPAWLLTKLISPLEMIGAPVLAIVAGMLLGPRFRSCPAYQSGIAFSAKKILQYAVVLLGFGLNLATIRVIGITSLPIILCTITISLVTAALLYRKFKIPAKIAILLGVGSSICGGSAIAATAPVIDANEEEITQAISVIFLFNILAALIFPTLGEFLGLSNNGFGLFAGTAINDTSSVTAAASTWDSLHSTSGSVIEYATVVKLTRTLAIIPITLTLAISRTKKEKTSEVNLRSVFPIFIIYFVFAAVITTILTTVCSGSALVLVNQIFRFLKQFSKFLIVIAMAAIGLQSDMGKLIKSGGPSLLLGACCWIAITMVSLGLQYALGLL